MKRTASQNKRIWGRVAMLSARTGMSRAWAESVMRAMCQEISGDFSTSKLSFAEADRLIKTLQDRIEILKPAPDADALITTDQINTLKYLSVEAGIRHYEGFCMRIIDRPWPQTRADGIKMHQALNAMILQKYKPKDLRRMVGFLDDLRALSAWENDFIDDIKARLGRPNSRFTAGMIGKLLEIFRKHTTAEPACKANG